MNTQFWGPDGWKLLHSVTAGYPLRPDLKTQQVYSQFFESIQHILPCIYCRNSYSEYIAELPVREYAHSREGLTKWIYLMHNKVNAKLRGQGLLHGKDPSCKEIVKRYERYLREVNQGDCTCFPGMNFIYCILFNFPMKKSQLEPIRYAHYILFFTYLADVLPFPSMQEYYKEYITKYPIENAMETRASMKRWGYRLESYLYRKYNKKCMPYSNRCELIEMNRAGCSKISGSKKGKSGTCRLPSPMIKKVDGSEEHK
jgi:hypothetical protein